MTVWHAGGTEPPSAPAKHSPLCRSGLAGEWTVFLHSPCGRLGRRRTAGFSPATAGASARTVHRRPARRNAAFIPPYRCPAGANRASDAAHRAAPHTHLARAPGLTASSEPCAVPARRAAGGQGRARPAATRAKAVRGPLGESRGVRADESGITAETAGGGVQRLLHRVGPGLLVVSRRRPIPAAGRPSLGIQRPFATFGSTQEAHRRHAGTVRLDPRGESALGRCVTLLARATLPLPRPLSRVWPRRRPRTRQLGTAELRSTPAPVQARSCAVGQPLSSREDRVTQ